MKDPTDFLKTVYLGDRACKSILIGAWERRVALQVDRISRIRDPSGTWNFYSEEDITDGLIVFSGVKSLRFDPPGFLPNDYIVSLTVEPVLLPTKEQDESPMFVFKISVGSVDSDGNSREVVIEIAAKGVHLEDPARPGVELRD